MRTSHVNPNSHNPILGRLIAFPMAENSVSSSPHPDRNLNSLVSNTTPEQNTRGVAFAQVLIDGAGRQGIPIPYTWRFRTVTRTCSSITNSQGIAACGLNIGMATPERAVSITATFRAYGNNYSVGTSFTIKASLPPPCDPSYPDVCILPGAADYDFAGGSGNGPNYIRGTIRVLPPDPHGLDREGDGVGCE
jgi:hypothetical protein